MTSLACCVAHSLQVGIASKMILESHVSLQAHSLRFADVVQGIQTEALQCVGQLGGLDRNISIALSSSGVMDGLVLAQTHENPRIKVCRSLLEIGDEQSSQWPSKTMLAGSSKQSSGKPNCSWRTSVTITPGLRNAPMCQEAAGRHRLQHQSDRLGCSGSCCAAISRSGKWRS